MSTSRFQSRTRSAANTQVVAEAARRAWDDGDLTRCLHWYRRALRLEPHVAAHHIALGNTLQELNRISEAIAAYNRALQISPAHRDAYVSMGRLYVNRLNRPDLALPFITGAIALNPADEEAYQALGECISLEGSLDGALMELRRLAKRGPIDRIRAYHGLQTALADWGRYYEAKACNEELLRILPGSPLAHTNLGRIAFAWHDLKAAITYLEKALSYEPNNRYSVGLYIHTWMQLGDYERARHERNKRLPRVPSASNKPCSWSGESLREKRIVLNAGSAGFGDGIQIVRLAEKYKEEGAHVIVKTRPELARLTKTVRGIDEVIGTSEESPPADFECGAHEIVFLREIEFHTLGSLVPYIFPPLELCGEWKPQIGSGTFLKVGIAWRGADLFPKDRYRQRSMRLSSLRPLLQVEGVEFFSLQKGRGAEELNDHPPFPIKSLGEGSEDFLDTATAISFLDLIITVDTSVAHLAGAMGKPTWILVPYSPIDWRWQIGRTDDVWYPTVRLFRQSEPGDWAAVVTDVVDAIRSEIMSQRRVSPLI